VHLLVYELYRYQNARYNDKNMYLALNFPLLLLIKNKQRYSLPKDSLEDIFKIFTSYTIRKYESFFFILAENK